MFLPFGLRTSPRIFNLFSEAAHWILETLYGWHLTHYLDDFLAVFPPGEDTSHHSECFDEVMTTISLSKAPEKDADGTVVTHLGFEFDSMNMEVRLPPNKKLRALRAVQQLMTAKSVSFSALEEVLGFLSHCCQVVPLGRPFLRRLFALLRRNKPNSHRTRIPVAARRDIRWWLYFLTAWSSVSIIRLSRINYDAATDASGVKGIGGVFNGYIFSERIPSRHREKHINWKEMFAILHAFILWHKRWAGGRLRLACDNTAVVDAVSKRSIKGETINPLQIILLIAAVFDIDIQIFWVPSEENIVADAASRHDFKKLTDLGFQVSGLRQNRAASKISTLRQQLYTFLKTLSLPQPGRTTILPALHTKPTLVATDMSRTQPPSSPSHTGSPPSPPQSNRKQPTDISKPYSQPTSKKASLRISSTTRSSRCVSAAQNESTARATRDSGSPSQPQSSSRSSLRPKMTLMAPTSRQRCAWHLPDSFDLVNLRGIHPTLPSYIDTSSSTIISAPSPSPSPSPSRPQKPTPSDVVSPSSSLPRHPHFVLSPHSAVFIPGSHSTKPNPYSLAPSAPSIGNTSSTKSKGYSSEQASQQPDSLDIPYAKALQSPLQQLEYPVKISNSSDGGKATLSTSTLTKSALQTIPENSYNSTTNSILPSRLPNSSLPWPRRRSSPLVPSSLQHLRLARRDLQRSPRSGIGGVRLRKRPVNGCT